MDTKAAATSTRALGRLHQARAKAAAALAIAAMPMAASAHGIGTGTMPPHPFPVSFVEVFTFLFVVLGPLNVIGPFLAMTKGRTEAFRRDAAIRSFVVSLVGIVVVTGVGAATLHAWNVSLGAILATGGGILVLVALRAVLAGYSRSASSPPQPGTPVGAAELAFSPLAFPTIVTPYGLALLVLLFALYPVNSGDGLWILATALLVLVLDLVAMLSAGAIAKIPQIEPALNILGCVMSVLLVALGLQAVADGLRILTPATF